MPIFRRTNCIITASGIVTLCTVQYSMHSALIRHTVLPFTESDDTDAVIIQIVLLKMGVLMLETCRGL